MCLLPGRHLSLRCGHSRGFCGTPRRTSWTSCRSCRSSMCLCCRWGISWWKCCRRSTFGPRTRTEQLIGQNSTAFRGAEHVDIPVPLGRGGVGSLSTFLPDTGFCCFISSSHSPGAADEAFTGFFALSPNFLKNARLDPRSGSELAADSSPSTRRAYGVSMVVEEDESEPVTESEVEDEGEINDWVDDTKKRSQWHPPWRRGFQ